jgi:hypothetical protein
VPIKIALCSLPLSSFSEAAVEPLLVEVLRTKLFGKGKGRSPLRGTVGYGGCFSPEVGLAVEAFVDREIVELEPAFHSLGATACQRHEVSSDLERQ